MNTTGDKIDALALKILRIRSNVGKPGEGKVVGFLDCMDDDGRLRFTTTYHAAHTGRDGGRRFQPQNLPRGIKIDVEEAAALLIAGDMDGFMKLVPNDSTVEDALQSLIRGLVCASDGHLLAFADYNAVEPRGTAWLAGEFDLLNTFIEYDAGRGPDPYKVMAGKIFGVKVDAVVGEQRQVGKAALIGCGYGMGAEKFEIHAKNNGADLQKAGVTGEQVVDTYRDACPMIAGKRTGTSRTGRPRREGGLWNEIEATAKKALTTGTPQNCGSYLRWESRGMRLPSGREIVNLHCFLPSGRSVVYPDAKILMRQPAWAKKRGMNITKPTLCFHSRYGSETPTYGGKLTENVVQAICRDECMWAEIVAERQGIPSIITVHDELGSEVESDNAVEKLESMVKLMSAESSFHPGFSKKVEGHLCKRYAKNKPKNAVERVAINGVLK